QEDQKQISRVQVHIAAPEPLWFRHETKEPFESSILHPLRSLGHFAGKERKRGANREDGHSEHLAKLKGEDLLPWATQSDKKDGSAGTLNALDDFELLRDGETAKFGRLHAGNLERGPRRFQLMTQRGENLRSAAVEIDGDAFGSGARTEPAREIRTVDAIGEFFTVQEVESPANGLTIWEQEIEVIETEFLLAIEDTSHEAMNGQGRN